MVPDLPALQLQSFPVLAHFVGLECAARLDHPLNSKRSAEALISYGRGSDKVESGDLINTFGRPIHDNPPG